MKLIKKHRIMQAVEEVQVAVDAIQAPQVADDEPKQNNLTVKDILNNFSQLEPETSVVFEPIGLDSTQVTITGFEVVSDQDSNSAVVKLLYVTDQGQAVDGQQDQDAVGTENDDEQDDTPKQPQLSQRLLQAAQDDTAEEEVQEDEQNCIDKLLAACDTGLQSAKDATDFQLAAKFLSAIEAIKQIANIVEL